MNLEMRQDCRKIATNPSYQALRSPKYVGTKDAVSFCMKLAIPTTRQRIAPLFDSATNIELYATEGYGCDCVLVSTLEFPEGAQQNLETLYHIPVDTVVCGAISNEVERLLVYNGVEVFSFLCGPVQEVLKGWKERSLHGYTFSMPGCLRPHHCPKRSRDNCCIRGERRKNH